MQVRATTSHVPSAYRVVRARTVAELSDATRVRYEVYSKVMGLDPDLLPASREVSGYDLLETTMVFVAYAGDEAVGTIRLALPNPALVGRHASVLGLPLEVDAEVAELPEGAVVAELGRAAVLTAYQGTAVVGRLYRAAYLASRAAGVTDWIGYSLLATDSLDDASTISRVLASIGKSRAHPTLKKRKAGPVTDRPARALYSDEQRRRAAAGKMGEADLPRAIAFNIGTGFSVIGPPVFDDVFKEFMIPIFMSLDEFIGTKFGWRYCGRG